MKHLQPVQSVATTSSDSTNLHQLMSLPSSRCVKSVAPRSCCPKALKFRALPSPGLLLLLLERPPQDLPTGTLGYFWYEGDATFQPLVSRFVLLNMLLYVSYDHPIIFLEADRRRLDYECFR